MTGSDDSGPDCPDCYGSTATYYSYYECDDCHEPIGPVDAVPIAELEQLADEMEKYGGKEVDRFTAKLNFIMADYRPDD